MRGREGRLEGVMLSKLSPGAAQECQRPMESLAVGPETQGRHDPEAGSNSVQLRERSLMRDTRPIYVHRRSAGHVKCRRGYCHLPVYLIRDLPMGIVYSPCCKCRPLPQTFFLPVFACPGRAFSMRSARERRRFSSESEISAVLPSWPR